MGFILGTLITLLITEAVLGFYLMNGYYELVELIYTVIVMSVMIKFIFTTKYFIDKKVDK